MRVIAGEFRSRRLISPPGLETRPTPDRLREAMFNILGAEVEGTVFVDAYAGTGSVGIEALSRGAGKVIFIEKDRKALEVIRKNLESLRVSSERVRVIAGKAHLHLTGAGGNILFLDPPYTNNAEYRDCLAVLKTEQPGLTIVQHSIRTALPGEIGSLRRTRTLEQGDNALSFYRAPG